jgi:ferritin-like metal-binding protein YciE
MEELKKAFTDYSLQVQAQLLRLEEIFGILLIEPGRGGCETISGMISGLKMDLADAGKEKVTRDAILVLSIRKAIYYKIATYSALEMLADSQGMEEASNLLHLSLEEEKDSDMVLTDIAQRRIKNL